MLRPTRARKSAGKMARGGTDVVKERPLQDLQSGEIIQPQPVRQSRGAPRTARGEAHFLLRDHVAASGELDFGDPRSPFRAALDPGILASHPDLRRVGRVNGCSRVVPPAVGAIGLVASKDREFFEGSGGAVGHVDIVVGSEGPKASSWLQARSG
jgi:hypothetical protein